MILLFLRRNREADTNLRRLILVGASAAFVIMVCSFPVLADTLKHAQDALDKELKREGNALVSSIRECPDIDGSMFEYVTDYEVVPFEDDSYAVLVSTRWCNGGNKNGRYFLLIRNNKAKVVTDAGIGDMSFLGHITSATEDAVEFYGQRWLPDDAHCCPSQEGTLRYDLRKQKTTFEKK